MPEENESKSPQTISRRKFLKLAGVAGTSAILGNLVNFGTITEKKEPVPDENILEQIQNFEKNQADKPLSFENARSYIPLLVKFYNQTYPTLKNDQEIEDSIYIFRHRSLPDEYRDQVARIGDEEIKGEMAYDFIKNYPNHKLMYDDYIALDMRMHMFGGLFAGTTESGNILVLLDRVNDPNIDRGPRPEKSYYQYDVEGNNLLKHPQKPVVNFRSLIIHELVHSDVDKNREPDSELEASFGRINARLSEPYSSHKQFGFTFNLEKGSQDNKIYQKNDLEELMADYFMFKLAMNNSLSFAAGHNHTPIDINNFEKVLRQSNISDIEVYKMHQENKVKDFMLKVASGAKNVELKNQEDMIDFGMKAFVFEPVEQTWTHLQQYFDGIEIEEKEAMSPHLVRDLFLSEQTV